jgi:hypothetical protein
MASKSVEAANTQKRKHISSSSYSRKEKNTGDGKRTKEEEVI